MWHSMSSDVSMSSDASAPDRPFFEQMSPEKVLEQLDSSARGLDREAASTRLKTYGLNRLPDPPKPNALIRFLRQFHNMLIYLLLGAAVITMVLGHMVDASIILAVVLINALIGYIQEGKAEQAMDSIRKMLSPGATVIRGGMQVHLDAENLVPGDVVVLSAGDKVPADSRSMSMRARSRVGRGPRRPPAPRPSSSSPAPEEALSPPEASVRSRPRSSIASWTSTSQPRAKSPNGGKWAVSAEKTTDQSCVSNFKA